MADEMQAGRDDTRRAIDEGSFVTIHGLEQWVTLRGKDVGNPVLLIIPGAGAGMSVFAPFFAPWESEFTVAQWDQPHAGVTYTKHRNAGVREYSIGRLVRDGIAVVEHIRAHLGVRKVVLLALSSGTIVGLRLVRERPDLVSAYVGVGQIVNWARQDALSYAMVLEQARAANNAAAVAELERIGAPPYPDTATDAIKAQYAVALTALEQSAFASLDPSILARMSAPPSDARYVPSDTMPDKDPRAVAMAAYDALRSEIVSFDAEHLGLDFAVPMLFLQGEQDACTVSSEVRRYASVIRAPRKAFVPIEGAGHSPWMMRDQFLALLSAHVRPVAIAGE